MVKDQAASIAMAGARVILLPIVLQSRSMDLPDWTELLWKSSHPTRGYGSVWKWSLLALSFGTIRLMYILGHWRRLPYLTTTHHPTVLPSTERHLSCVVNMLFLIQLSVVHWCCSQGLQHSIGATAIGVLKKSQQSSTLLLRDHWKTWNCQHSPLGGVTLAWLLWCVSFHGIDPSKLWKFVSRMLGHVVCGSIWPKPWHQTDSSKVNVESDFLLHPRELTKPVMVGQT